MKKQSTLFVFFNLKKKHFWNYKQIPDSWKCIGKGFTEPVYSSQNKSLYEREEQFNGNTDNVDVMREYLNIFFSDLSFNDIISNFKITNNYNPL